MVIGHTPYARGYMPWAICHRLYTIWHGPYAWTMSHMPWSKGHRPQFSTHICLHRYGFSIEKSRYASIICRSLADPNILHSPSKIHQCGSPLHQVVINRHIWYCTAAARRVSIILLMAFFFHFYLFETFELLLQLSGSKKPLVKQTILNNENKRKSVEFFKLVICASFPTTKKESRDELIIHHSKISR